MAEVLSLGFDALRPPSPFMLPRHIAWRAQVREFIDAEVAPYLEAWDAAGTFPDELYQKAVGAGVFGMGFAPALGGAFEDADLYHRIILAEEFHRLGSGLVYADIATHWIALPPVITHGSDFLVQQVAGPVLRGERKMAFAVTEPSGGSDVASMQTQATRSGDTYLLNGTKALISSAMRADWALVIARTGGPGLSGLSVLLVDLAQPGVTRTPARGLGWYNKNIGTLKFENAVVPLANLIGTENQGFAVLGAQLNTERFSGIAAMLALARSAAAEAIAWAKQRQTFGKRLIDHQAIRHKLIDMVRRINVAYAYMDRCVWQFNTGKPPIADLALLKVEATEALEYCASTALHVVAGAAYDSASRLQRIAREARTFSIAGGTEEILKDLAARQLKF